MRRPLALACLLVACGARTALVVTDEPDAQAPIDAGLDRTVRDGPRETTIDRLPPIDVIVPDVIKPLDCADAAITFIYLFSTGADLLSFDPQTSALKTIGKVACPSMFQPNSMAVDHDGVAFANFYEPFGTNGELFRLSTSTAACTSTAFKPQSGFFKFGMGFTGDQDGGERLYISDTENDPNGALAWVDTKSFQVKLVGTFDPPLPRCELTGTGDGRLFAFCMNDPTGSTLAQIDPKTAKVIGADSLSVGGVNNAFAFGFWGGDFYLFTSPGGGSTVTKFDPVTKKETFLMNTSQRIVGAGVSTCAPL